MNDDLEGLTLANWVGGIWFKYRRGVPLTGYEGALAHCMEFHKEWRSRWDSLGHSNDPELSRDVLHVHYDAMVKVQIDSDSPPEIRQFYNKLREKAFTEFEALHTLIPPLTEALWMAKTKNEPFDNARYIQLAKQYVDVALMRPTSVRRGADIR
ncbi:MAG TPA: DUF1841 family protein [Terriglobia bacterium]|jgi:hypothetical protein